MRGLKKLFFTIITSLFLLGNAVGVSAQEILKVGISADYPPFEFLKNGKVVGYDVDFAHLLASELGKRLQVKEMNFDSLIPSLQYGKIDMAISSITYSEERAKNIDFSKPYFLTAASLLVYSKASDDFLNEIIAKKIGVQMGTVFALYLKDKNIKHITELARIPELVEELKLHRIDAIILDKKIAASIVKKYDGKFKLINLTDFSGGNSVVLPKNSPLTKNVDSAIMRLRENGKLEEIKEKWLS